MGTLPTSIGEIESEISYTRQTPEVMFSLLNMDIVIQPIKVNSSFIYRKDTFVNMFITSNNNLKLEFRFSYINTKRTEIIEDEEYYHLKISEVVRVPKNKEVALRVTIDVSLAKIIFSDKPDKEQIIEQARLEMASYQTQYNPNADGRLPKGTIYGWGGSR